MSIHEKKPAVLCWDLDNTLGDFTQMEEQIVKGLSSSENSFHLRYGITELLEDFSKKNGFLHYVVTSNNGDPNVYATEVLQRSGLLTHFQEVLATLDSFWGGKQYQPVARRVGFNENDSQARMVVIGDQPGDAPVDISGLVFINLGKNNMDKSAFDIRHILTTLLEKGDGNFLEGFDVLHNAATPLLPALPPAFQRRTYMLGDMSFQVKYLDQPHMGITVPTIDNIQVSNRRRPQRRGLQKR